MGAVSELFGAIASWRSALIVFVVFGVAPGLVLRLLVKIYPKEDSRRAELIAELYAKGRIERVFFVGEQLETVIFEGIPVRVRTARTRSKERKLRPRRRYSFTRFYAISSLLTVVMAGFIGSQSPTVKPLLVYIGPSIVIVILILILLVARTERKREAGALE